MPLGLVNRLYKNNPHIETINPIPALYGSNTYIYCKKDVTLYHIKMEDGFYQLVTLPANNVLAQHHSSQYYTQVALYQLIENKEVTIFYKSKTQARNKYAVIKSHGLKEEMALFGKMFVEN